MIAAADENIDALVAGAAARAGAPPRRAAAPAPAAGSRSRAAAPAPQPPRRRHQPRTPRRAPALRRRRRTAAAGADGAPRALVAARAPPRVRARPRPRRSVQRLRPGRPHHQARHRSRAAGAPRQPLPASASRAARRDAAATSRTSRSRRSARRSRKRLAESIGPIPTFYLTAEFDLDARRPRCAPRWPRWATSSRCRSTTSCMKAVATALAQHPEVQRALARRPHPPASPRAPRHGRRDARRADRAGDLRRRPEAHERDRARGARARQARARAKAQARGVHGLDVLDLEPRHVRHRPVHGDHQSAGGGDPGDRRGAGRRSCRTATASSCGSACASR